LSFAFSSAWAGILRAGSPDVIVATSPPLTVAATMAVLAAFHRVPAVFEVRDLWPETAIEAGILTSKPLIALSYKLERLAYRRAAWVNVLTPAFQEAVISRKGVPADRVSMIPNAADLDLMRPGPRENAVRQRLGLQGKFVVSYFGAHGKLNHLSQLLDVAERIRTSHPDVRILLVGEGMEKQMLVAEGRRRCLDNVLFLDPVAKEQVVDYINASDVCTAVLLRRDVFRTVYPNKVFDYMSCARPTIIGIDGVARKLVEDGGAGLYAEPENTDAFIEALLRLKGAPALRDRMGQSGYDYVRRHYTRERLAERYLAILERLAARKAAARD
jgi:glycosyltransferase involved in cell wall biosynthesis